MFIFVPKFKTLQTRNIRRHDIEKEKGGSLFVTDSQVFLSWTNRISSFLSRKTLLRIYKQTILPVLDYGCIVWADCAKQNSQRLERL